MHGTGIVLSKASGVPFYRQLRDQLSDRIRSGALAAGTPLPSIRELAAQLLVSVITVKSAYEELEADGLIVSRQGRGTFVAERAQAASKRHFEAVIATELTALAERASRVGVSRESFRDMAEGAIRKGYRGRES